MYFLVDIMIHVQIKLREEQTNNSGGDQQLLYSEKQNTLSNREPTKEVEIRKIAAVYIHINICYWVLLINNWTNTNVVLIA